MEAKAFAGIDVGKAAHMCCIVDAVGNVLAGSFPFANDAEGFSKPLAELRKAGRPILVGMEATGHYGEALKRFLAANGVPYAEYNPAGIYILLKRGFWQNRENGSLPFVSFFMGVKLGLSL